LKSVDGNCIVARCGQSGDSKKVCRILKATISRKWKDANEVLYYLQRVTSLELLMSGPLQ
jgi:disulfide oxidoreductase YuzD